MELIKPDTTCRMISLPLAFWLSLHTPRQSGRQGAPAPGPRAPHSPLLANKVQTSLETTAKITRYRYLDIDIPATPEICSAPRSLYLTIGICYSMSQDWR